MSDAKISIDQTTCTGCGTCVALDPKHFSLADDGKAKVIGKDGKESPEATVETCEECKSAADSCPVSAIKAEE